MFEIAVFLFDLCFWWVWLLRWFVQQFAFFGNTYILGKTVTSNYAYASNYTNFDDSGLDSDNEMDDDSSDSEFENSDDDSDDDSDVENYDTFE